MGPGIINRNILLETIPSFLVNLAVFTFILLMARVMSFADLVVTNGVSTGEVLWILALVMPKMLSMSIPMAALLSSLTTFLRMSADSELTVLKASGVDLFQLLPPVALFGLAAALLTALFSVFVTPAANLRFREEILTLAKARADLAIKEQIFVRDFPGLTIYVGQIPLGGRPMTSIMISDRRSPSEDTLITASEGLLDLDLAEGLLLFRLSNGVIDRVYTDRQSVDSVFFGTYELKISPGPEFEGQDEGFALGRSELPTGRLLPEAERVREAGNPNWIFFALEFHRRFSFPAAALIMPLIGMPLGASFRTRGRNFGLLMGLLIFLLYYSVFSLGWTLGSRLAIPAAAASWAPVALAAAAAAHFLRNMNRTASIDLKAAWRRALRRLSGRAARGGAR